MEAALLQARDASAIAPGTVVWGRVKGYPWWPALVVPYELVLFLPPGAEVPAHEPGKVVLQFFSDGRISLLRTRDVQLFAGNEELVRGAGQYQQVIAHAAAAAQAWLAVAGRRVASEDDNAVLRNRLAVVRSEVDEARRETAATRTEAVAARRAVVAARTEAAAAKASADAARTEVANAAAQISALRAEVRRLRGDRHGTDGASRSLKRARMERRVNEHGNGGSVVTSSDAIGEALSCKQTAKLRVCIDLINSVLRDAEEDALPSVLRSGAVVGEMERAAAAVAVADGARKTGSSYDIDEDADEEEDSDEPVFVK